MINPAMILKRLMPKLTAGLAVACLVLSAGWYVSSQTLDACREGRRADAMAYEAASTDSLARHLKQIRETEDGYRKKAEAADADYGALHDRYRESVRLFAQGNKRSTGGSSAAAEDRGSIGVDGSSKASSISWGDGILVQESDLAVCAENTARLVVARDWALGLND